MISGGRRSSGAALVAVAVVGACSSGSPSLGTVNETVALDCVAVLGAPPGSPVGPLAGIPYSGLPRTQLIGELTDAQLGRLCDYNVCLGSNGYGRVCYTSSNGQAPGQFNAEAVALVVPAMLTCYPTVFGEAQDSWDSREDCMATYRSYFGTCHVGSWEDCLREGNFAPMGAFTWGPDCDTTLKECPVN